MSIKFENENVMVDATRYVVNGKTYPINNITSVESGVIKYKDEVSYEDIPAKHEWANDGLTALLFAIAGLSLGYFISSRGFLETFGGMILGLAISGVLGFILMLLLYKSGYTKEHYHPVDDDYVVRITTASGQIDSYKSGDKDIIDTIVEAINQAIIERG